MHHKKIYIYIKSTVMADTLTAPPEVRGLVIKVTHHLVNPLNAELNPICHLQALLGAHHTLHISRIRVKVYVVGASIDVQYSQFCSVDHAMPQRCFSRCFLLRSNHGSGSNIHLSMNLCKPAGQHGLKE